MEDALLALLHRRQDRAAEQYRHESLIYALAGGKQPPQFPAILKG